MKVMKLPPAEQEFLCIYILAQKKSHNRFSMVVLITFYVRISFVSFICVGNLFLIWRHKKIKDEKEKKLCH